VRVAGIAPENGGGIKDSSAGAPVVAVVLDEVRVVMGVLDVVLVVVVLVVEEVVVEVVEVVAVAVAVVEVVVGPRAGIVIAAPRPLQMVLYSKSQVRH